MHVVFRESRGLEDADAPFDPGQDPAQLVVLSFSDSDLGAFAAAASGLPVGLRVQNLVALRHTVSVDAYGGRIYKGRVDSIASATGARFSLLPPENATGNYVKVVQRIPVKLVFEQGEDAEHQLRPGMSVLVKVKVK